MHFYDNNYFYVVLCFGSLLLQIVWVRFAPGRDFENKKGKMIYFSDAVFCICMALAISTLFRLFPGNTRIPAEDSSVFLYIGKRMTEGKIPYRDLFDHKGPILYFIEYLGIKISKTDYTGVWLLEALNILITIVFMRKLGRVISDKNSSVYLAVLLCAGVCGWKIWQGGNFTEEYALPWITFAAVVFFLFFKTGSYRRGDIVLLGIGFAVVFLLRANMIAIWVALMPLTLFILIREKRFSDIIKCLALFLLGIIIVVLPIFVYSLQTKSAEAMWRNYILFNISYTDGALSVTERVNLALYFCKTLWPGVFAIVATLLFYQKKKMLWANLLFFIISLWFVTMSGRGYYHYAIILLPAFVLPFSALFDLTDRLLSGKDNTVSSCRPWIVMVSFFVILAVAFIYRIATSETDTDSPLVTYIQEQTAADDNVLILGNSCWYYLMSDRKSENYYFYQLPPAEISLEIYNGFIDELTKHPSRLIVLPGSSDEREAIDIALRGIRDKLFEMDYRNEIYDEFEAFWLN